MHGFGKEEETLTDVQGLIDGINLAGDPAN